MSENNKNVPSQDPNEKKKIYIEARDIEGNLVKKTAPQWSEYQEWHGNSKGNSSSSITRRYLLKLENGYTNQQIVDASLIERKRAAPSKKKKQKPVDCRGYLARFNQSRLVG